MPSRVCNIMCIPASDMFSHARQGMEPHAVRGTQSDADLRVSNHILGFSHALGQPKVEVAQQ